LRIVDWHLITDVSVRPIRPFNMFHSNLTEEERTDRLFQNVDNYQYRPRNIPEEWRSNSHRDGSL